MASFNSTDADVESLNSTDTGYRCFSSPRQGSSCRFLVFDCEENSSYLTVGRIIEKKSSLNAELIAQRDFIINYGRLYCSVIDHDTFASIFGTEHHAYLAEIHSIIVFLPYSREEQVTFFVSKSYSNSPVHVCQNAELLESHAPFFCKSLLKPVSLDNIQYVKHELAEDHNIQFCCQKENAETFQKVEYFNTHSNTSAHYLNVIKNKSNIVKFVFHKSYQSSQTFHMECHSTDTIGQVLKVYLKHATKDLKEFQKRDLSDIVVTDDIGKRVDTNRNAVNCLLFNEKLLIRDRHLDQSYPTFLIHLTPKENSYLSLKCRVYGEERGHMHPLTVFVRNNCSTEELRGEISKHCHWNPKSFEVCLPNSHQCIEDVEDISKLKYTLNDMSVLTVRRVKKLSFTTECSDSICETFVIEAYPYLSVEELKSKISKRCDILPKQFDLFYKGKLLEDKCILEDFVEKRARVEVVYNEQRIVFKLYLHKEIPNRINADIYNGFVHLKVDNPTGKVGDITKSFSEKLHVEETDLHLVKNGFYLDKSDSYTDIVSDGSILCLYHTDMSTPNKEKGVEDIETVFQVASSGQIEIVTKPLQQVQALEKKLRNLELKTVRSEPNFQVISQGQHKRRTFNRMISVPSNPTRRKSVVAGSTIDGYKSDTDLVRRSIGPKPSPSDSQICIDTNRPTLNLGPNSSGMMILTPPLTPPNGVLSNRFRHGSGPGTSGYSVNLMVWGQSEGNLPNISSIIGPSQNLTGTQEPVTKGTDRWNQLFLHIHKQIVSDWKNVGRHLLLDENNIEILDQNAHNVEEKAYSMLKKWRQCKGQDATKAVLIQALEDAELKMVAEIVQDFFNDANEEDLCDLEEDGLYACTDDEDLT